MIQQTFLILILNVSSDLVCPSSELKSVPVPVDVLPDEMDSRLAVDIDLLIKARISDSKLAT